MASVVRARTLSGDGILLFEFVGRFGDRRRRHRPWGGVGIIHVKRPMLGRGQRGQRVGAQQLCEVGPLAQQRSARSHVDRIPSTPSQWFGFRPSCVGALRIISVPCGGLSWRRDRLPEDDDALSAKSAGIESRADSGRRGCTASSQLGAARRPGLLGTMASLGRTVSSPVTGGTSHPKATGSGLGRMESSRGYRRSDWLSPGHSPDWRSPWCPSSAVSSPRRAGSARQELLRVKRLLFAPDVVHRAGDLAARMPSALALLPHLVVLRCSQRLAGS